MKTRKFDAADIKCFTLERPMLCLDLPGNNLGKSLDVCFSISLLVPVVPCTAPVGLCKQPLYPDT